MTADQSLHIKEYTLVLAHLGNIYAYILGWPLLAKFHLKLFYLCARALGLLNYSSVSISGEKTALRLLAGRISPVVFDVGAYEGQWLAIVLSICPSAQIHAFEPQKTLAAQIQFNYPSVKINNIALGDAEGELDLFDYADQPGSQHASLLEGVIDGIHRGTSKSQRVSISTLNNYCEQNNIEYIDYLKVDVEGFELKVLQGAKRLIKENRVDVIQFEFTQINLVGRTLMRDFFSFLSATHQLYRLLPHGLLHLQPSDVWMNEQFVYQNILALRKIR